MKYPVLLPNIFDHPFTYESLLKLKTGDYVKVPFGKKIITGIVWDQFEENDNKKFKIRSIKEKLKIEPLQKETINFLGAFMFFLINNEITRRAGDLAVGRAISNFYWGR